MTETSTPPPGLLQRLVLRLLMVAVLISAVVGVWWIITGKISESGARLFLNGLGIGMFGVFGLGAQHAGKKTRSWFARLGPAAAVVGGGLWLLGVWFDAWNAGIWWRALGVAFFVSFAGLRGALIAAADVNARGVLFRSLGLAAVSLTMGLGVLLSLWGLGELGWRLFGVGSIVEMAAVVMVLIHRGAADSEDTNKDIKKDQT